ncbi:MAG: hypothetical protein ABIC92_19375 [Pseudomonadota bacterium]
MISAAVIGTGLAADGSLFGGLPDMFGANQRMLPPGALQVDDAMADLKGYRGTILIRGVMAVAPPDYPGMFGMIDSREARVCRDLHCAKQYLPVKASGAMPQPWDELNVRGKVVTDGKLTYLQAESIENLGSIRK